MDKKTMLREAYVKASREYEAAHKVWMNTVVHSEAGRVARLVKDRLSRVDDEARRAYYQFLADEP